MSIGEPVHGEVVSADASGGVAFKLYKSGETGEHTLAATEYVNITDYSVIRAVAETFAIVADTDVAGKRVVKNPGTAAAGVDRALAQPFVCPAGVTPKLIAAAGDIVAVIEGFITGA